MPINRRQIKGINFGLTAKLNASRGMFTVRLVPRTGGSTANTLANQNSRGSLTICLHIT